MKVTPRAIAGALVDCAQGASEKDLPALLDAALRLLEQHGLIRHLRVFPRLVEEARIERLKIQPVSITTPSGTLGPAKKDILSALETLLQKSLEVTESQDPSLIGGAVVTFGDERFDFSLKNALSTLRV